VFAAHGAAVAHGPAGPWRGEGRLIPAAGRLRGVRSLLLASLMKITEGLTGLMCVETESSVFTWHLDVDLDGAGAAGGGSFGSVHPFFFYMSWVQNDVSQFGLYLLWCVL